MMAEKDRQTQIIEAAMKRFSHFGINKTTLTEIAEDASLSRQAFLYYFHDKNALLLAVVEQMMQEYLNMSVENFQKAGSAEAAIYTLLTTKEEFFKKYYLLAIQGEESGILQSDALSRLIQQGRKQHILQLSQILQEGIDKGEFREVDTLRNARLILEILHAFEHRLRDRCRLPEPEDFKNLFHRQKEVLQMVVAGLKCKTAAATLPA